MENRKFKFGDFVVVKSDPELNRNVGEVIGYDCIYDIHSSHDAKKVIVAIDTMAGIKNKLYDEEDLELYKPEEQKPPLGLIPRNIWEAARFEEVKDTLYRYLNGQKVIPAEWIAEYNDFIRRKTDA